MFTAIIHDEVEKEFVLCLLQFVPGCHAYSQSWSPTHVSCVNLIPSPWATGYLKSGQWAPISHEDCGYIRAVSAFFY